MATTAKSLNTAASEGSMSFVKALQCRECGKQYLKAPLSVCEYCFGPLEVSYDYAALRNKISREVIQRRTPNMWRYRELLPIDGEASVGKQVGFTPLVKAVNLAKRMGLKDLYVKNDSVCFPTLSFKDRVVSVALTKALEFGFDTVACASTGNLSHAVSAHAAHAGVRAVVFVPSTLEPAKIAAAAAYGATVVAIDGTYDDVNRLCAEATEEYAWAFVNVNLRPYYAEGSKTIAFETAEQLGWRAPDHVVVPIASGALLTRIGKPYRQLDAVGLLGEEPNVRVSGAQAAGCNPVAAAFASGAEDV